MNSKSDRLLDTYQNLRNARRVVGDDAFFLVTSAYHFRRALGVSCYLAMKAIPCPAFIQTLQHHPSGRSWRRWCADMVFSVSLPSAERLTMIRRALHQYTGYLWYGYRGII
ncbi:MAG: YdcF family protein [Acidimicrobiia bacterium]|nr:YdcF family protein [Acidimicrobiia bacterium]